MTDKKATATKPRETRGGYPAGDKLVSELKPPPPGPAPGGRRPSNGSERK